MTFQDRISYSGPLDLLIKEILQEYNLGEYIKHEIIEIGFEDLNIKLCTNLGTYLIKFYAKYKSRKEIQNILPIIEEAISLGIKHPKIYYSEGKGLNRIRKNGKNIYFIIIEYIDAPNLLDSKLKLTKEDKIFLTNQIALFSKMKSKQLEVYDEWAVLNLQKEYEDLEKDLDIAEIEFLKKRIDIVFHKIKFEKLPKTFIHGDITATNLIKKDSDLYIIDFSVASYSPRIQDLAILLTNTIFNNNDFESVEDDYDLILNEYLKLIELSDYEINALPYYLIAVYLTNIIGVIKNKKRGFYTSEAEYWLMLGYRGIEVIEKTLI